MGMECLHCKYILVKCKLYGPTEMIEKKGGAFKCLNEICLINEFGYNLQIRFQPTNRAEPERGTYSVSPNAIFEVSHLEFLVPPANHPFVYGKFVIDK